ncbi:MAG: glycosyltransferase [Bdellovibrionales bacterium]
MKILQVMAGGKHGGAETAFVDMCIAMHEAGQEVEVITRPNALRVSRLRDAGLVVHTLPFGGTVDVYTGWQIGRIIRQFQPDIVQGWMQRAPAKIPAWRATMGIPRYRVVSRLGGYYKLKYYASTDYFITITPDIKRHLVDHGVDPARVWHLNNFADVERADVALNRSDYGVPDGATLLLGLGRLHTAKAFDVLIRAAADLPDVYVWIAGEGPEREALEALITELDCADRVRLLGWRSDRAALFQASDICVFCSRYEPFGSVFIQAWAQKTPLIATKADGARQFVRHEEDGLLVDIDDVTGIKAAISRLAGDAALSARLVENGFARYKGEFSKETCVQAYLDYYRDIHKG